MYIIGGDSWTNQDFDNYQVHNDRVERLYDLEFSFNDGRCVNYDGYNVIACAAVDYRRDCWEFDGDGWYEAGSTNYDHWQGDLASYHNDAVMIGNFRLAHTSGYDYFSWISIFIRIN